MGFESLLKGLVLGVSIAAPIGPIGILCIRRTLTYGKVTGIISGLGAACADAVYGIIASIGLTFVTTFLINQQLWLQLTGAMFLSYLGIRIFTASPSNDVPIALKKHQFKAFSSTFLLTLTNPMTILTFAAIFSGVGIVSSQFTFTAKALLVAGVFLGSAIWWVVLSLIVSYIKDYMKNFTLVINKLSGSLLILFSLWSFYTVAMNWL